MENVSTMAPPDPRVEQRAVGTATVLSGKEEPQQYRMWSAIYHDRDTDNLFLWYDDGTLEQKRIVNTFYTPNRGEFGAMPCGMKDIYGREMYAVQRHTTPEQDIRKRYRGPHNHLAEIDIDPRARFLQKHYANTGMLKPDMKKINICFLDIEVETTGRFPAAHRAEYPINCVTIYFSATDNYVTYGVGRDIDDDVKEAMAKENGKYVLCETEADLLRQLFTEIGNNEVAILSGWNFSYDTTYMVNRAEKLGVELKLMSRLPAQFKKAWVTKDGELQIAGTEVIDFLALYRKYTFSEEPSYKLDYIGGKVCNEHKAPLPDGYRSWKNYWSQFIYYNWQDVRLLKKIELKERMFQLCVTAAAEAHVPFSFVFESKKMLVGFVMNYLHQNGMVFPAYREQQKEEYPGAFVYSIPGFYEWLVSYDYRSLYPSIMMTFNTSPETKVIKPMDYVMTEEERATLIESPWTHNGKYRVYFRKDKEGIVPKVTRLLFDGRANLKNKMKAAKKAGDHEMTGIYDMMQKVYKVLGNSLYGLLGSNYFPLYDVDNAASITAYGRNLIKFTIEQLAHYLNEEVCHDQRFIDAFGYVPKINPDYLGTILDDEGQVLYKRMSHGDTDSFYCKVGDLFEEFHKKEGTGTEVIVYKGHKQVERFTFDNSEAQELESKKCFNRMCNKYAHDTWHDPENRAIDKKTGLSKVKIMFHDGIVWGSEGHRILYSRYRLTDFCRMMDAVILEEKLDEFMLAYATKWGYLKNELFLKREKCIYKAIVTAKKKYICEAESNEDIVYLDKEPVKDEEGNIVSIGSMELTPDFAVTGLEIVRSSTTLFSRERMMDMVKLMLKTMDKAVVRERLLEIKREFYQAVKDGKYSYIAMPSGMKEEPVPYPIQCRLPQEELGKLDWRRRAASVWNYLIENDPVLSKEPYEPITAGEKMKFLKKADEDFGVSIICYTGEECPQRLIDLFHIDWDNQWRVSVSQILGRLFTAVGWPEELEYDESDAMLELI